MSNLDVFSLSLLAVFVLWLVATTIAVVGHVSSAGSPARFFSSTAYRLPRPDQATLTGFRGRAVSVMQNHQEQAGFFVAALVANSWLAGGAGISSFAANAALVHVVARLCHVVFYLLGWSVLRTTAWSLGVAAIVTLFVEHLSV